MYCNRCGKGIPEDANLCSYCGSRVGGTTVRKRLVRLRQDRKIAGVCTGLADYLDVDVTLVRLAMLIVFFTGVGVLAYPIAWIVMPEEPLAHPVVSQSVTTP